MRTATKLLVLAVTFMATATARGETILGSVSLTPPDLQTFVRKSEADFLALMEPGWYTEDFDYSPWTTLGGGIDPTAFEENGWQYTLSSFTQNGLDGLPTFDGGGAVSTWWNNSTITIAFDEPYPHGFAGWFAVTEETGAFRDGARLIVTIHNPDVMTDKAHAVTHTVSPKMDGYMAFMGFVTNEPITYVEVTPYIHGFPTYAVVDHVIVGIPEPGTLVLLVIGSLIVVAYLVRGR